MQEDEHVALNEPSVVVETFNRERRDVGVRACKSVQQHPSGAPMFRIGQRFDEHAAAIEKTCNKLGIDLTNLQTDQPLELALFDFLNARLRRGRHVARRQSAPRRPTLKGGR